MVYHITKAVRHGLHLYSGDSGHLGRIVQVTGLSPDSIITVCRLFLTEPGARELSDHFLDYDGNLHSYGKPGTCPIGR